jgi:hypothetical protein
VSCFFVLLLPREVTEPSPFDRGGTACPRPPDFSLYSTQIKVNNDPPLYVPAVDETYVWSSATLSRYIARALRVSARHLPWEIVQQMHAQGGTGEAEAFGAFPPAAGLQALELEDYNWRVDVTRDNIEATKAQGWHVLHRLLLLAQVHRCEALELARENLVLPAVLEFEIFAWP